MIYNNDDKNDGDYIEDDNDNILMTMMKIYNDDNDYVTILIIKIIILMIMVMIMMTKTITSIIMRMIFQFIRQKKRSC